MSGRQRGHQPPLKTATKLFILGVVLLIAAVVIPFVSLNCTDIEGIQHCVKTTYFGMNAHTFAKVLVASAVVAFCLSAFHYRLHKHELQAPQSTDTSSMLHRHRHE